MIKPVPHYFRAGYIAGKGGLPATANPLLFKAWPWHAWRLGHEYGQLEAGVNEGNASVYVEAEHLERADKTPSDQGQVAYVDGRRLEDCPYDPGSADWTQWRRGWLLAFNTAKSPERRADDKYSARARIGGLLAYLAVVAVIAIVLVWAYTRR